MDTILNLKIGEVGIIKNIPINLPLCLMEIGFLPGANVKLIQIAPLDDPIYLIVNGSHFAVRKEMIKDIKILKYEK